MARRYREKKKKGCFSRILIILLCVAVAGTALYFGTDWLKKGEEYMLKAFYPLKYSTYVDKAAEDYDLDPALVYAVIKTESNFDSQAYSSAGAMGLMQMMPESFQWVQELRGESYKDNQLYNPEINVDYGCYFLDYFLDYYGNEQCAVAAYNAGFVVSEWLENPDYSSGGETLESIPYSETAHYVEKVAEAKEMYNKLYFNKK